jgi:hypothetical protein
LTATIPFAIGGDGAAVEAPDVATGRGTTTASFKLAKKRTVVGRRGLSPSLVGRRDTPADVSGRRAQQAVVSGQQQLTVPVSGRAQSHKVVARRGNPARLRPKGW